jgi:hypothetical protein
MDGVSTGSTGEGVSTGSTGEGVSTGSTGGGSHRRTPVNVRGDLVGHDSAEQLDVEDDRTTALATLVLGAVLWSRPWRR